MRQERVGGDLAIELCRPAAGDLCGAIWATALRGEAIVFDEVAVTFDESFAAIGAARVFPFADSSWKIAGIDIAQAGFAAYFGGLQKIFWRGVALAVTLHFVVGVEGGDVPGNVE